MPPLGSVTCDVECGLDAHGWHVSLQEQMHTHFRRRQRTGIRLAMVTSSVNENGEITRKAWLNYMCTDNLGFQVFKSDLFSIFEKYDKDNSGGLTQKEILEMMKELFSENV